MLRRVVVTGLGAVTPLGVGVQRTWQRLLAGESGIVSLAGRAPQERWKQLPSTVAGAVPEGRGEGEWNADDWLDAAEQRRMSRFTQFAIAATEMALTQARWPPSELGKTGRNTAAADDDSPYARTGVCLGSGIGNLEELYDTSMAYAEGGYKRVSPLFVPRILLNMAAGHISMRYGFQGPNHTVSTACTTGAHSLGDAARFIAMGDADVMVAGGAEACLHPLTLAGFARSRSLATPPAGAGTGDTWDARQSCRPFDRDRNGFVVAEGAAVLLLEELGHARARGVPILAELCGYGCSGDAWHMTAPHPSGIGALRAMRRALQSAGLRPRDVDYVNAHATGTLVGDAAEAAAIRTLMLDEGVADESTITVSSTKGAVGHLLGAAGSIEAIFSVLAINDNTQPIMCRHARPVLPAGVKSGDSIDDDDDSGGGGDNDDSSYSSGSKDGGQACSRAANSRGHRPCAAPIRSRPRRGSRGVRHFHATPRDANITERLGDMARQAMRRTVAPYSAFGATREMYQKCTQPAAYSISEEARRTDNVPTTEDGEEIGVGGGLWHDEFNLLASFSTWSQVTMLHMYLLVTRLRCFDKETYQMWQSMLSDHFFQEAEDKMDVVHHITSRGLRQRHLQDLFMAWRGVIVAYDEGLVRGDAVLAAALWRNLFKARPEVDLRHLAAVVSWMRRSVSRLGQMPDESVLLRSASGIFSWPSPEADLALVDRPATQELRALLQQHKENASTSAQGAPAENDVPEANGKGQLAAA
ncbi:beta-ketoacyl synthase [Niveomyces insectorum RCEF 264]|uniref:beta-ketoacyl-[acyl-carrier-protein] synthase I n=1 Tax=Niveomyces insectorum RCEF 264 TaxID=1081102 RepID=A0A167RG52_9HYPO|nr:beta-ketoacyl synthase [Niveomyces insectorum RCEF 264]